MTQTAKLSERRARLNWSPSILQLRHPHNQQTQFTMQFNVLPALMLIIAASAILEATAVPIANIMRFKGFTSKTLAKNTTTANATAAGQPVGTKQMAKGFGW
ncbi:uncharacterized protein PGTG_13788 [Puccinia graminis f. sp. tritici CRL 75-36-700-3]|uniref:Uncharacterized protein n=1 Tax=Puccinia graminis f. sp. tritici (strain CRL 75-36-700-3 / race SCCL) TaxID=418459 RepID=E3KUN4_PUCGT|nr:uncharacterized protein PGTG_13788 [Puccinia graminis f. sp. tritici CRL 75-36-700-3]EFP87984.2 hypothetical protein PGTG_13788 [Puccinia graminis f. sp. tritici CRL 75-36-700-3]